MKNKFMFVVWSCWIALASVAVGETRMQVSGGSTPIRSKPAADSPAVGQAKAGEILFVERIEGDWAAISPPERIGLWLNKDFIEGNRVVAKSIQLRAGPGVEHPVVGTLQRNDPVMPKGESGDWCKISAPSSAILWVQKSSLTEVRTRTDPSQAPAPAPVPAPPPPSPPPPKPQAPAVAAPPAPPPPPPSPPQPRPETKPAPAPPAHRVEPRVLPTQPQPTSRALPPPSPVVLRPATALPTQKIAPSTPVTVPVAPALDGRADITVDPALVDELNLDNSPRQGKVVQVEGELRNAPFMAGTPSRYRLQARNAKGVLEMVCHIHGNSVQLRPYIGKKISVVGKEYSVEDSDMPVVVVGQITSLQPSDADAVFF